MNIELLQGHLPITENAGLDSTDPRFDEIATLVQAGNYTQAAQLSQQIIADGIYDIRLICYFLYGDWHEHSPAHLIKIINGLSHLMQENWEAVGPSKKREKNFQTALSWLFRQILKKLQYEEKKQTPLWQQWLAATDIADIESLLTTDPLFCETLEQRLETHAGAVLGLWSKITVWLHAFQVLLDKLPEVLQTEQASPESAEPAAPPSKTATPALTIETDETLFESSYHMKLLLKKLAAFEWLLAEKKFPQAALVADDINQTLAAFDPMVYFPKTFAAFVRLQVIHFEDLSEYEGHRGSPQWQAMQDWLKIDLESFINN